MLVLVVCGCGARSTDSSSASTPSPPPDTSSITPPPAPPATPSGTAAPMTTSHRSLPDRPGSSISAWTRTALTEMPDAWFIRDGAQMVQLVSGRVLLIGGWNHYDPWGPNYVPGVGGGDRITNEVWASDDLGKTWTLLLAHDPNPPTVGPNARFPPGHTIGAVTYKGHARVVGTDPSEGAVPVGDVWAESDNGATWTRITTESPAEGRFLFMCGTLRDDIYVMGGQWSAETTDTGFNDVWRSHDGGLTWEQLANAPWKPRGMVYRPVEHDGKLYVVGGGLQADNSSTNDPPFYPIAYNGVYAFDGNTWTTILPDGHDQFTAAFYLPVVSIDGVLWLFNGYDPLPNVNMSRALFSEDDGLTWQTFADGSGGAPSHADAVGVVSNRILRLSGNMDGDERTVWQFGH